MSDEQTYEQDPDVEVTPIPEQDLTPVEADDDYDGGDPDEQVDDEQVDNEGEHDNG